MKKLLLTCFVAVVVASSANAQTAKAKKQTANLAELSAKSLAEKKAKDDAMQERKKQLDLEAVMKKNNKANSVLPTPDNTSK